MEHVTGIHALLIDLCTNLVLNLASSFQQQSTLKTSSFPHGFVTGWPVHPKIPKKYIIHEVWHNYGMNLSVETEWPLFYANVQFTEFEVSIWIVWTQWGCVFFSKYTETPINYPKFQAPYIITSSFKKGFRKVQPDCHSSFLDISSCNMFIKTGSLFPIHCFCIIKFAFLKAIQ